VHALPVNRIGLTCLSRMALLVLILAIVRVALMVQKTQYLQRVPDQVPPRKPIRLGTLRLVRREMGRVYRDARSGRIPTSEATRLTYILVALARTMEMENAMPIAAKTRTLSAGLPELDALLARTCAEMERRPEQA
jgi:hypothetical protein